MRLTSSRREGDISDIASPCAHFSPSCSIFSIVLCPPMRVLETSLSLPSFSPLFYTFVSFSVSRLALLLHPFHSFVSYPLSPSFVASVPRVSPLLSGILRAALCDCLPRSSASLFCPRHAFRPRAGWADRAVLTSLLMAHRIEREVDPCCYAAITVEIREWSERERERESVAVAPKRTGEKRPL